MPAWVADDNLWQKAKDAASKSYSQDDDAFWPVVATIYQNMGGTVSKKKEAGVTKDPQGGIRAPVWLWAADPVAGTMPDVQPSTVDQDKTDVLALLNKNPTMQASTFLNLLKAHGFEISKSADIAGKEKQIEAVSASSNTPLLRAKSKESISDKHIAFRFLEGVKSDSLVGPTRFKCVLIQEGMGNLRDAFYYTAEALKSAVPIFEGKKIYADHPSMDEEQTRPERSVRDVLGHFENVRIEEADDGRAMLVGDVVTMPEEPFRWARALMAHACEFSEKYPDKDFVGLSINASGDANEVPLSELVDGGKVPKSALPKLQQAMQEGIESVRLVTSIEDAVSCDLVTEAGAGGKLTEMIEGNKQMKQKKESEETEGKKKEAADDMQKDGDGADAGHADADQDKALIAQMIKKYMGGGKAEEDESEESEEGMKHAESEEAEESEEAMKHAHEAYEYFHKERGMETEEAAKHAAEAVKCAMRMAAKHADKKAPPADQGDDGDADDAPPSKEAEKKEKKKEAKHEESSVAKLQGRIALLESQINASKLEKHIEKSLKESKLPRQVTDAIRKVTAGCKSVESFDRQYKNFMEGFKAAGTAQAEDDLFVMPEKLQLTESDGGSESALSLGDCVRE